MSILLTLLNHLNELSSISVEMEGLILKPFSKDTLNQSLNISSIFGKNEDKYNLFLWDILLFYFSI